MRLLYKASGVLLNIAQLLPKVWKCMYVFTSAGVVLAVSWVVVSHMFNFHPLLKEDSHVSKVTPVPTPPRHKTLLGDYQWRMMVKLGWSGIGESTLNSHDM